MRISDWSSDVCSSDLALGLDRIVDGDHLGGVVFGCRHFEHVGQVVLALRVVAGQALQPALERHRVGGKDAGVDGADVALFLGGVLVFDDGADAAFRRSEEHTSELQSLMRISYAFFCLKQNKTNKTR